MWEESYYYKNICLVTKMEFMHGQILWSFRKAAVADSPTTNLDVDGTFSWGCVYIEFWRAGGRRYSQNTSPTTLMKCVKLVIECRCNGPRYRSIQIKWQDTDYTAAILISLFSWMTEHQQRQQPTTEHQQRQSIPGRCCFILKSLVHSLPVLSIIVSVVSVGALSLWSVYLYLLVIQDRWVRWLPLPNFRATVTVGRGELDWLIVWILVLP